MGALQKGQMACFVAGDKAVFEEVKLTPTFFFKTFKYDDFPR